ncbi:MAG: class I SAM-dependent methyltransferase [Acidimicrobiales bacterium]
MRSELEELLAEQVDFYRADAAGYDAWLRRLQDPDNLDEAAVRFRESRRLLLEWLENHGPFPRVLEIAAGTGILAELLIGVSGRLDLLDTSEDSLRLARERLSGHSQRVGYIGADVFSWDPGPDRYDLVAFSSWLHHVPRAGMGAFWKKLETIVAPGGSVLFDFPTPGLPAASVPETPPAEPGQDYAVYRAQDDVSIRDRDGRRCRVVHVIFDPTELAEQLAGLGWQMTLLGAPGWFDGFCWAVASKTVPPGP